MNELKHKVVSQNDATLYFHNLKTYRNNNVQGGNISCRGGMGHLSCDCSDDFAAIKSIQIAG